MTINISYRLLKLICQISNKQQKKMLTRYSRLFPLFVRGFGNALCNNKGRTKKVRVKLANGHYLGEFTEGGYKIYRKLTLFVAFPILAIVMAHCYIGTEEHERPPFVKYGYLRRRTKRFPWGDGTKSLFHNPHTNPLPDGYEEEEDD